MERRIWMVAASVFGAVAAHAERPGVYFAQTHTPSVTVVSSHGNSYDDIAGQAYPLTTRLSGHCGGDSWVNFAKIEATGVAPQAIDISELRPKEQDLPMRPVLVPYSLTAIEMPAAWKQAVVQACNLNLAQQKAQRQWSNAQVLARDWPLGDVKVTQMTAFLSCDSKPRGSGFDSSGIPTMDHSIPGKVRVICGKKLADDFAAERKPLTGADDLSYGVHVVQAHLTILPKTGGTQPCGVTLSGVIETDVVNTNVTFSYRNNKGGSTPLRSVKTDHSKTAFFSDFIPFNEAANTGGFVNPAPHHSGPAAGTFAAPQSGKEFDGTYQIVGKNIAFESNLAHFAFNCAAPPVGSLTGAGKPPAPPVPPLPGSLPQPNTGPAPTAPGSPTLPSKPTRAVPPRLKKP